MLLSFWLRFQLFYPETNDQWKKVTQSCIQVHFAAAIKTRELEVGMSRRVSAAPVCPHLTASFFFCHRTDISKKKTTTNGEKNPKTTNRNKNPKKTKKPPKGIEPLFSSYEEDRQDWQAGFSQAPRAVTLDWPSLRKSKHSIGVNTCTHLPGKAWG